MTYSVAVAGASGYAGGELLRLLAAHPEFSVNCVTAHSNAGQPLIDVHPHLRSLAGMTLKETAPEVLGGHDVVFLALPHGASGDLAAQLADVPLIVDCGADHRLESEDEWAAFYGSTFHGTWTYGMPELVLADGSRQRARLRGAARVAVPGCNATAVTLGLAPGVNAGVIDAADAVATLAVGTSGAGKAASTRLLASEIHGSASAYGVGGTHRHIPEIRQNLMAAGAHTVGLSFTPMLVPMARGILASSTAKLAADVTETEVRAAWHDAYGQESFVQLLPAGQYPRTADTLGANTALVGLAVDEAVGRVVTLTAIDNLVKGTAGAAIQSANLALSLPEATGLQVNGVAP